MENKNIQSLKNIGATIAQRLNEIGIYSEADLAAIGAIEAFQKIKANYPQQTIPVCYYLYSLQGALLDLHWNDLPAEVKTALITQAKQ
jgi:DNA transformation protein